MKPSVCLFTDSLEPSGVGHLEIEQILNAWMSLIRVPGPPRTAVGRPAEGQQPDTAWHTGCSTEGVGLLSLSQSLEERGGRRAAHH